MSHKLENDQALTVAVFTFPSSHYAMRGEKLLKEAGIPVLLIPLPREIRSDCGVALLLPMDQQDKGAQLLKGAGLPPDGVHAVTRTGRQARMWRHFLIDSVQP